ncbi:MAG: hypothetical protein ABI614_18770 [Planctomycetota bacterium]
MEQKIFELEIDFITLQTPTGSPRSVNEIWIAVERLDPVASASLIHPRDELVGVFNSLKHFSNQLIFGSNGASPLGT